MSGCGQGAVCFSTRCAHQQARFRDLERGCRLTGSDPNCRGQGGARPLTLSVGQPVSCPASAQTCQTRLPACRKSPETAGQPSHCWSPGLQGQKGHMSPPGHPCTCPGRAAPCQTQGCVWISSTGGVETGWDAWLGQATCWQRDCGQSLPLGIIS